MGPGFFSALWSKVRGKVCCCIPRKLPTPTDNASLANISLGWMVREAIEANVDLLFLPKAFDSYLGVLAIIGPSNCHNAGLKLPPACAKLQPTKFDVPNRYIYNSWNDWKPYGDGDVEEESDEAPARSRRAAEMEQAFANDARASMGDNLGPWLSPWWVLEWLPSLDLHVQPDGLASRRFRFVLWRFFLVMVSDERSF